MAKKSSKSKITIKCQCSRCDQIAFAQEGTEHYYCKGIHPSIIAQLPPALKGITNPTRKGKWMAYVEPVKVDGIPLDSVETSETIEEPQAVAS